MVRLTRQVRFALNGPNDPQLRGKPTNSFGGFPTITALSPWLMLEVTLAGELNPHTGYLRNIREIDEIVRQRAIPLLAHAAAAGRFTNRTLLELYQSLAQSWPGARLDRLRLAVTPLLALTVLAEDPTMVHLSQKFEFSASHRLHNPELSDDENRACFGKCNNPAGHGHNYELQVTVTGDAANVSTLPALECVVEQTVIARMDHRNLNMELPEFSELNPTVENIARTIFHLLQPNLPGLRSVTVWETPKTWAEYSE